MTYHSNMNESTKEAMTIIDKIKQLLYNFDLAIVYAKGEIKLKDATINLYINDSRKYAQKKFVVAKVDKERYENYISELENAKNEILDNLNIILSKYTPRYKQVFISYFFENATYEEICQKTNYSFDAVNKIISKLKNDVIGFYFIS